MVLRSAGLPAVYLRRNPPGVTGRCSLSHHDTSWAHSWSAMSHQPWSFPHLYPGSPGRCRYFNSRSHSWYNYHGGTFAVTYLHKQPTWRLRASLVCCLSSHLSILGGDQKGQSLEIVLSLERVLSLETALSFPQQVRPVHGHLLLFRPQLALVGRCFLPRGWGQFTGNMTGTYKHPPGVPGARSPDTAPPFGGHPRAGRGALWRGLWCSRARRRPWGASTGPGTWTIHTDASGHNCLKHLPKHLSHHARKR